MYKESPFLRTSVCSEVYSHSLPPRAQKYHKIHEYLNGKWPTVSLFWTTFTANLLTTLSSFCSAWSILPIAGFPSIFIDVRKCHPHTSKSNVNFPMFELTPRFLHTFEAWLLSTPLSCFNGETMGFQLNGVF